VAEQRVGILVEISDKATSVLKGIGSIGKSSLGVVREAGQKAGLAFKAFGMATTFLNQGMEIASKGMEIFRSMVLENITAMIEYRGENDSVTKKFRLLAEEAQYTRAVFVDLLTPAILGLQESFSKVGSSVIDYINTNRQMIATRIIEFLQTAANVLVDGVGEGLVWVSRAVSGLIEAWNLLGSVVNSTIGSMVGDVASLLDGLASVSEWAGRDELAESLRGASGTVRDLSKAFHDGANENIAAIERQVAKQSSLENSIRGVQTTVRDFVNNEAVPAMLRFAESWDGVTKRSRLAEQAMMTALQRVERQANLQMTIDNGLTELRISNLTRVNEIQMKQYNSQKEGAQAVAGAIGQIGNAWTNVATAAIASSANVGKAVVSALIDSVVISINAVAAMAAARAFAAHQDFPIVGVAIGLAAAAAAAAIAKGFLADVPAKAARGYRTPAGGSTEDVYPVLMRGNEVALDPTQTKLLDRLVSSMESGRGSVGGSVVVNYSEQTLVPTNTADTKRKARDLDRLIQKSRPKFAFQG
jgi:hypothetical protein